MKIVLKLIAIPLFLISIQGNAQDFKSTITYKLLRMDADIWGENDAEIKACEELMGSAVNRIKKNYSPLQIKNADIPLILNILKKIDSSFTEFGFLYHGDLLDPHSDFLTAAFRESFKADNYLTSENTRNKYRRLFWQRNQLKNCFLIDCDLYCEIYYGIAQMLSLPLNIVETPQHNYLRWRTSDGNYLCWDTNEGEVHFDEKTITGYSFVNNDNRSQFLQEWTIDGIESHYRMLRGDYYFSKSKKTNMPKSASEYLSAMSLSPNTSMSYCNFVWIYIMHPELKDYNDSLLMAYIDKAMALEKNLNFYDAKACLYAIRGDFKKAIETEEEGLKVKSDPYGRRQKAQGHLDCFNKKKICRELK